MDAKTVKKMPIKDVVNDPVWQEVRQSLVGRWMEHHRSNVSLLEAYLDVYEWSPLAVRRVLNVLTGTVHRTGKTKDQEETNQLRKKVRICWKDMLGESFDPDDPKYRYGTI